MLEASKQYRIVAKEVWYYNINELLGADAQYYTAAPSPSMIWEDYFPAPGGHSFLQINGQDIDWDPFSNYETGHTYTIIYIGAGTPIEMEKLSSVT